MNRRDRGELPIAEGEATEEDYIQRAFELAYFIHPTVGVALRIAEEALCKLPHTFGKQDRRYRYIPSRSAQPQERPSYPLRTKVSLRKEHLLQLLVYAESDSWERCTEQANVPYRSSDEDMVIRFIKHLVQITLKRSSFYVVLGVGRLLYNYQTSQVSQIYDILMQDHARFRENSYLRRQKNLLMQEIIDRFGRMIRMVKTAQGEYRFLKQPTTQPLISLVNESLRRCTPWGTTCVVPATLDPAESIEALSSKGANPDEESSAEMNRIHTILDPNCFSRLVVGLGLESPEGRLAVPQFFFSDNKEPPGDRFNPPRLASGDKRQIKRASDDRARRRNLYSVGQLRIYIDDVESLSFDPRTSSKASFEFGPQANVIEVRGQDSEGELPLATLLVSYKDISEGGSLGDSVVLEGGQRLTILLTAITNAVGETKKLRAEIHYAETEPLRFISWMAQLTWRRVIEITRRQDGVSPVLKSGYSWPVTIGLIVALLVSAVIIITIMRNQRQPAEVNANSRQAESVPSPTRESSPPSSSSPSRVTARDERVQSSLIARATWNNDPKAADEAVRIKARRGSVRSVEISSRQTTLLVALDRVDATDQLYSAYRIVLMAGGKSIWQQTLKAPHLDYSQRAHVMNLEVSTQRLPKSDSYRLRVEGQAKANWEFIGQLILKPDSR